MGDVQELNSRNKTWCQTFDKDFEYVTILKNIQESFPRQLINLISTVVFQTKSHVPQHQLL